MSCPRDASISASDLQALPIAAPRGGLGFWSLLALGVNGTVGVGIFFVPAEVAHWAPGMGGALVYLLTGIALLPVAAVYARLGSAFNEDGGPYVWARSAFGRRVAFGVGWIAWTSAVLSSAAIVMGLATHLQSWLLPSAPWAVATLAVSVVLLLGILAARGLEPSKKLWSGLTVAKLLPLGLLLAFAAGSLPRMPSPAQGGNASDGDLFRAMLVAVFAAQGFEIVPVPAGKVAGASRGIANATTLTLLVSSLLYMAIHAACARVLPTLAQTSSTASPVVLAAQAYGGVTLSRIVSSGIVVSALGISFGMVSMTPRYLATMGRDDGLGAGLRREDAQGVPQLALWITVFAILVPVVLGRLADLFTLSSLAVLVQYGVSTLALACLAWRRTQGLTRLNLWPVPLSLAAIFLIGFSAQAAEILVLAATLVVGFAVVLLRTQVWKRCFPGGNSDS